MALVVKPRLHAARDLGPDAVDGYQLRLVGLAQRVDGVEFVQQLTGHDTAYVADAQGG